MDDVIYADILFIINFSMDFLTLLLTSRLARSKISTVPLIIASSLGAIFAVVSTVFQGNIYITHIINFALAYVMCYIAFSQKGFFGYLRITALFYGVGFVLGGIMTAFYSFLNKHLSPRNAVIDGNFAVLYSSIPTRYFALLALISAAVSFVWTLILRLRRAKTVNLEVALGENEISCTALCDSGNLLCDPISALPVILIKESFARELLPDEMLSCIENHDYANALGSFSEYDMSLSPRLIPAHGIGGEQMLLGFQSDKIIVDGNLKCALCAVCPDNAVSDFDAIVPSELCS